MSGSSLPRKGHGSGSPVYGPFSQLPPISVLPVTDEIAERAAFLRAHYGLKTPDALQLATTLISASHAFLTNDERIPEIEGIQVLILDRYLK